ncbi:MAG: hypothetical protein ACR2KK_18845 [Acidimicrobiales bacterium]
MTEVEAAVMAEHATYWMARLAKVHVVAFGPGPRHRRSRQRGRRLREMGAEDPAVTSQVASFDVHAMPGAVVRARGA